MTNTSEIKQDMHTLLDWMEYKHGDEMHFSSLKGDIVNFRALRTRLINQGVEPKFYDNCVAELTKKCKYVPIKNQFIYALN